MGSSPLRREVILRFASDSMAQSHVFESDRPRHYSGVGESESDSELGVSNLTTAAQLACVISSSEYSPSSLATRESSN